MKRMGSWPSSLCGADAGSLRWGGKLPIIMLIMRRLSGIVWRDRSAIADGRNMVKRTDPPPISDEALRALLQRYACPVPFHEVRTRFLGNIATPVMSASPIKMVQSLWDGELPAFDSIDTANELIGALIMGLWNRLTRHQQRNSPFRLTRIETRPTREGLSVLALMRRQELDGFVEGLFAGEEVLELPERAHRGLGGLSEMRALFAGVLDVTADDAIVGTKKDMEATLKHLQVMTRNAEHEMHAIVLSCTRARRQALASVPVRKPTLH
jgi:hypothetical protein